MLLVHIVNDCPVHTFDSLFWDVSSDYVATLVYARIQRGAGAPDHLKNHKNIGFLSNTGPDPLNDLNAAKLAFNVGQSLARQRNAISI